MRALKLPLAVTAALLPAGLLAGAGTASAAAHTYYVSPSGSDSNSGTSAGSPFRTLQKAADLTRPGDTVLLMSGTFRETARGFDVVNITRSGSPGKPITYRAAPGQKPVINPVRGWNGINISGASYINVTGLEIKGNSASLSLADAERRSKPKEPDFNTNCLNASKNPKTGAAPHHLTITGNHVHHCPGAGISAIDADHVVIDRNRVHSNAWYTVYGASGISILRALDSDRGDGKQYKIRITGNVAYDNETKVKWAECRCYSDGNGIIIDTLKGKPSGTGTDYQGRVLVANNVTFDNGGSGIHSYKSQHVDIVNNTAYKNARSTRMESYAGIYALDSRDVRILNNVSYNRTGGATNSKHKNVDVTYDYNLYFNGKRPEVQGPHDIVADPEFENASTDPASADFRLKKGSPAVGSGTAFPQAATDFAGVQRSSAKPDRGALALAGSASTDERESSDGDTSEAHADRPMTEPAPVREGGKGEEQGGVQTGAQGKTGEEVKDDGSEDLAATGADLAPAAAGVVILLGGAALVFFTRRRKNPRHSGR
ncbi:right-handed parallel beta-helix repeat-containing protein [Streptomyces sp. NPDC005496]|uniref:right-handed parallel beta-helix repeat-containing protein n=2 Tax=unclassified Streptomyces TaxID=2593676 RepID=UPI0036C07379